MESSFGTFDCFICYEAYDSKTRRPCIGQCGHSICELCKHKLPSSKCPQCNREESFAVTTINYQVLEVMKKAPEKPKRKAENTDDLCSECDIVCKRLHICVNCGIMGNLLTRDHNQTVVLFLEDTSVDAAIQRAKNLAVCADCALDVHKKHETVKLEELISNLGSLAQSKLEERALETTKLSEKLLEDLSVAAEDANSTIHELLSLSNTLPLADRKKHYFFFEINLEILSDINESFSDNIKKLMSTTNEITQNIHHIQHTGEVLLKKGWYLASSDPVLVADLKQNAKDPLLIGFLEPEKNKWSSIGRMPNPRSNYACASFHDNIYIIGGAAGQKWLKNVELYDKKTNLRCDCTPLKHGRTRPSATFFNGKLYVIGGYDGNYMDSVEIYDPDTNKWRDGPKLNHHRADCVMVVFAGELYVLGGYDGKQYVENIEKLDNDGSAFEVVGEMAGGRAGFGACVFRGRIYIAGGWCNSTNTRKDVRSYDPITKKWTEETAMNRDRKYFTLHPTKSSMYAIRGCADNWSLIPEVEMYDLKTKKWEIIPCVAQLSTTAETSDSD